jgi:hypothetical protein
VWLGARIEWEMRRVSALVSSLLLSHDYCKFILHRGAGIGGVRIDFITCSCMWESGVLQARDGSHNSNACRTGT